ncbi:MULTISPECIES: ParA family protein [unclassified Methylobacterium]|uniref:ParA family protein n=1 Tax=unclassified Methylobacterium TaxID=2615210 RepID=UPI001FBA9E30|nr:MULTISPECIES: ParA family protein [unclassified Methylobacterium]MCJ2093965.1 ParA family protein [Methylobacterium sp. J-072]MCJ2138562.1 ParA family protein [Methylobacterium sp. E-066]
MMYVLALTTQKGGSGKSTLAASLAVAAMQDGETVAALDTDPQASLVGWGRRRETNGLDVQRVEPSAFAGTLGRLQGAGAVSLVIVDTPGRFGPDVALVLREASLCLLPVKPSILDVEAARPTVEQLRLLKRQFAFVLNQCNPTTQARTLDAATALVSTGALAPSMVATRSDFLDSMTTGLGVTELAPKGKAAVEIRLLWQWIKAQLAGAKA